MRQWRFFSVTPPRTLILFGLLGYACLVVLWRGFTLAVHGGGYYQTSDWLINYSGGFIRRGLSGEIVLTVADWTGQSPVFIVFFIVCILSLTMFFAVLNHISDLDVSDRLFLALLSPAFLLFWVNDPATTHRKEILAFAAFVPLLGGRLPVGRSLLSRLILVAVFAVAVGFHEVNAFMAPFLVTAVFVRFPDETLHNIVTALAICLLAIAAALFAVAFSTIQSVEPVCARILVYGLSEELCRGIFPWLESGAQRGIDATVAMVKELSVSGSILLTVVLVAPVLALISTLRFSKLEMLGLVVSTLALLPAFVLAIDWGRWVSLAVFSLTFIALIRMAQPGNDRAQDPMPSGVFAGAVAILLGLGVAHSKYYAVPGFVFTTMKTIAGIAP